MLNFKLEPKISKFQQIQYSPVRGGSNLLPYQLIHMVPGGPHPSWLPPFSLSPGWTWLGMEQTYSKVSCSNSVYGPVKAIDPKVIQLRYCHVERKHDQRDSYRQNNTVECSKSVDAVTYCTSTANFKQAPLEESPGQSLQIQQWWFLHIHGKG